MNGEVLMIIIKEIQMVICASVKHSNHDYLDQVGDDDDNDDMCTCAGAQLLEGVTPNTAPHRPASLSCRLVI